MLAAVKPALVVVCTPDDTHDDIIVRALESGRRRHHRKADDYNGREDRAASSTPSSAPGARSTCRSTTASRPTAARIKGLLDAGAIGAVLSVDFHWYLDTAARRRLLPPLARLRGALGQPVRAQGDAPFRPAELVSRQRPRRSVAAQADLRIYGAQRPVPRRALQDLRPCG